MHSYHSSRTLLAPVNLTIYAINLQSTATVEAREKLETSMKPMTAIHETYDHWRVIESCGR